MDQEYKHKVLVLDDDKQVGKSIGRILEIENIEYIVTNSGESALEEIKKAETTFSLILADQRMKGMKGTMLLEHAKKLTPDTVRFLMTAYSEMDTIINAVNKGSIQRYITKPWDHESLIASIRSGIELYEFFLSNKKLLSLAKRQNAKLYELNCKLMETTKLHNKTIQELDLDIETIKNQIKKLSFLTPVDPDILLNKIEGYAKTDNSLDSKKLENIFSTAITEIYSRFKELSYRGGFEMPEIKGEME